MPSRASSGLTDTSLAAAVELNAAEWVRLQGRLPWVEWHDDGDAQWVFAGNTYPRNSVALARFAPEAARRRINEIVEYHARRGAPCNWVTGSVSGPDSLPQELRASGFKCMIHCSGMACDLDRIRKISKAAVTARLQPVEEGLALQPLTTERRRLRQNGKTSMAQLEPKQVWHFGAFVGDRPVGETSLCTGAGVAGVVDVEVLEGFRGRGIGTALVHHAVQHAKRLGFRVAVLAATGMGVGVYGRVGFQKVGTLSFWRYKVRA